MLFRGDNIGEARELPRSSNNSQVEAKGSAIALERVDIVQ